MAGSMAVNRGGKGVAAQSRHSEPGLLLWHWYGIRRQCGSYDEAWQCHPAKHHWPKTRERHQKTDPICDRLVRIAQVSRPMKFECKGADQYQLSCGKWPVAQQYGRRTRADQSIDPGVTLWRRMPKASGKLLSQYGLINLPTTQLRPRFRALWKRPIKGFRDLMARGLRRSLAGGVITACTNAERPKKPGRFPSRVKDLRDRLRPWRHTDSVPTHHGRVWHCATEGTGR